MIIIYGVPACPQCKDLKEYLESVKIGYVYINLADSDRRDERRYYWSLPSNELPIIRIGEDVIQGFNRKKIEKILGDKHKYDK